jgi:hypothetical protein
MLLPSLSSTATDLDVWAGLNSAFSALDPLSRQNAHFPDRGDRNVALRQ